MALTPNQIKGIIVTNGDTIKGLAFRFSTPQRVYEREDLSRVISGVPGRYPELREKLAEYIGMTVEEVFGEQHAKAA